MTPQGPDHIAGWKTADDWRLTRATLLLGGDTEPWQTAFEEFFRTRLRLRYLDPIQILQDNGTFVGEGFSIAAIQCSLIEFLESTVQGLKYRYLRRDDQLGPNEYSSSSDLFVRFLATRDPFATEFDDGLARDFYANVRCGLLHEARTKGGWRIHAKDAGARLVDPATKTFFRDDFQRALLVFVDTYGKELLTNQTHQSAFIRKFDDLCE